MVPGDPAVQPDQQLQQGQQVLLALLDQGDLVVLEVPMALRARMVPMALSAPHNPDLRCDV
ncbi:hypothetical protein [Dictyobacter aurantiacus]|uniref:hypothetical protein n=1 Tax=Dictyobacter aurantiacus TaxID=1936993 RepID=UPI001F1FC24D|nr:hypothetical protein [Dictyobacter aurantiacus]